MHFHDRWACYRASQIPGPGKYGAPKLPGPGGGQFSTANPKSNLDWIIYRAGLTPGPNLLLPTTLCQNGGRISEARPKSDLEWQPVQILHSPYSD